MGSFDSSHEEEIAQLLPKNIAKQQKYNSTNDNRYLKNICLTNHPFHILNLTRNKHLTTGTCHRTT